MPYVLYWERNGESHQAQFATLEKAQDFAEERLLEHTDVRNVRIRPPESARRVERSGEQC